MKKENYRRLQTCYARGLNQKEKQRKKLDSRGHIKAAGKPGGYKHK
jgi:hypothetical protein